MVVKKKRLKAFSAIDNLWLDLATSLGTRKSETVGKVAVVAIKLLLNAVFE